MRVSAQPWIVLACALLGGACDGFAPSGAPAPGAPPAAPAAKAAPAPAREIYKVPVGDSPVKGNANAKVTVIVFSEFQCPFCARAVATMEQLSARYGDELRFVFKHLPLPFHDRAMAAAIAAEAARESGKFWELHDKLFAQPAALGAADLERHAGEAGLDVARFSARMTEPALKARVDADLKLAETLGVRGTPTFFINGRKLVGAQPVEAFAPIIDEELARADAKLKSGVARANLYPALIEGGLEKAPAAAKAAGAPGGNCPTGNCGKGARPAAAADPEQFHFIGKVDVGTAPARGPKDAPITLVLFSDFECPYCKKVEPTIAELEKAFPGKIRVVWKNFPLPFHSNARPAAAAALTAHQMGKFWEMHGKLMENQTALDEASLGRYARELGLDEAGWKAGFGKPGHAASIDQDVEQGKTLGVTGTPTLFVNGRRIVGAHPLESIRTVVEQELAKVEGGQKNGKNGG